MTTGHTSLYSYSYGKSLSIQPSVDEDSSQELNSKALGSAAGAAPNAELAAWYEQANQYYQAVMSGVETPPSQQAWNDFLAQLNWAGAQMGMGNSQWGENTGAAYGPGGPGGMEPDMFGGLPGVMGTYVHTEEEARVGFTGNVTRDFWSNDIDIDVAPLSATVTAETTTDTRSQPPEDVIKITVKDPATGTEAIYFIHDYADADIRINVPELSQVTDLTGGLVETGNFRKNGGAASSEVDVPFEEQDNGDLMVEVPYGETINFAPEGGDNQTWDVYGHFNICVRPSDVVRVSQNPEGGYVVIVEHKDGGFDTFKIHEDFQGNINGYPQNVIWGDPANGGGIGEEIPAEFRGDITLNSAGSASSAKPSTPPDETQGNEATYNTQQDVEMFADFDDALDIHNITAPGEVVIHGASYSDTVSVTELPGGRYEIKVYKGGIVTGENAQVETYVVDGASKIVLDFLPEKISGTAKDDPIFVKGSGDYADTSGGDDLAIAQQLTDLSGIELSAEEILARASDPQNGIDLSLPPGAPNQQLFRFLVEIDPVLANLLRSFQEGNSTQRDTLYSQIRNRMVELLQILYPNAGVTAVTGEGGAVDNIMFGGTEIDFVDQDNDNGRLWELLGFVADDTSN